jgi:hypothetical protein
MIWLRYFAFALIALALRANTISYDLDGTHTTNCCAFNLGHIDNPLNLQLQLFDSSLGTLSSVAFNFTDSQTMHWGMNDQAVANGTAFTLDYNSGFKSDQFGIDESNPQTFAGTSCNCRLLTFNDHIVSNLWEMNGLAPDISPFVGTGLLALDLAGFGGSNYFYAGSGWIASSPKWVTDTLQGTVTYNYVAHTPEPRFTVIMLAGLLIIGGAISAVYDKRHQK